MRIVIDVSPLSIPRTGIGNYIRGMVGGLCEVAGAAGHEIVAFAPSGVRGRRRIQQALSDLTPEALLVTLPVAHSWRTAWSRLGRLAVERIVGRLDVFHFSDWMFPPQRAGLRSTTIHDLVPLRFPDWATVRTRRMHAAKYRNAVRTCDLVFTNSAFTAHEVAERLGIGEERLRVARPGIDPRFRPDGPTPARGAPYLLSVGTLEPRKNLGAAVEAVRLVRETRPELELVLAGADGWGEQPNTEVEGVRRLGFVPDDELAALYRGAAAFVYPSRFEGFGIPVVEALASGTPVVCSAHESLDEACGDAAFRADPESPEALADAILQALEPDGERRRRGLEHAASFTWRACGRAFLDGFESLARA